MTFGILFVIEELGKLPKLKLIQLGHRRQNYKNKEACRSYQCFKSGHIIKNYWLHIDPNYQPELYRPQSKIGNLAQEGNNRQSYNNRNRGIGNNGGNQNGGKC